MIIREGSFFLQFAVGVRTLYGEEFCTFHVHQLLHLHAAVQNWAHYGHFLVFALKVVSV